MLPQIVRELQDLTYLSWDRIRNSSGTAGSFLKSYSDLGARKIYYKLSAYDSVKGIVGHECVNEIIVDRLLELLGIEHLHYQLIHAKIMLDGREITTWLCASEDFKERGESKVSFEVFYQQNRRSDENQLEFCKRYGWEEFIYEMIVTDFLILNRDRHGANIEVLRNSKKKTIRPAPLFDHGLSLLFHCQDEKDLKKADVMEDKRVQSFIGSQSTFDNLSLIHSPKIPQLKGLHESDMPVLFDGLEEVLPKEWRKKIADMIWKRWCFYESFCNQKR